MSAALDLTRPPSQPARAGIRGRLAPPPQPCHSIRPWACVYTQPQAETWAERNLRLRGYVTFLPMMTVRRRDPVIRSLVHTVKRPLFSRYLFLKFDHRGESWSPIRTTPGVKDLVRCGSEIPYASQSALDAVSAALELQPQSDANLAPGTPVALSGGVLDGCQGVVLKAGSDMALVSLIMLGQLREVSVSVDCLRMRDE